MLPVLLKVKYQQSKKYISLEPEFTHSDFVNEGNKVIYMSIWPSFTLFTSLFPIISHYLLLGSKEYDKIEEINAHMGELAYSWPNNVFMFMAADKSNSSVINR